MKELKFSFFDSPKGIRETRPQRDIDLNELYLIFKSRELSIKTDKVRNSSGRRSEKIKISVTLHYTLRNILREVKSTHSTLQR
jgi:hypothetical protein